MYSFFDLFNYSRIFNHYLPPFNQVMSRTLAASFPVRMSNVSLFKVDVTSSLPTFSATAIAGIVLSVAASIGIIFALALCLHRRHANKAAAKAQKDAETTTSAEMLEAKMQRARDLGMHRWSMSRTRANMQQFQILKAKQAAVMEQVISERSEGVAPSCEDD